MVKDEAYFRDFWEKGNSLRQQESKEITSLCTWTNQLTTCMSMCQYKLIEQTIPVTNMLSKKSCSLWWEEQFHIPQLQCLGWYEPLGHQRFVFLVLTGNKHKKIILNQSLKELSSIPKAVQTPNHLRVVILAQAALLKAKKTAACTLPGRDRTWITTILRGTLTGLETTSSTFLFQKVISNFSHMASFLYRPFIFAIAVQSSNWNCWSIKITTFVTLQLPAWSSQGKVCLQSCTDLLLPFSPFVAAPHSTLRCLISSMHNYMHIFHFITLNSKHLPVVFYQPQAEGVTLDCLAQVRSQQQTKKLSSHFPHTGAAHILFLCHPASSCLKTLTPLIQVEAAALQILFICCMHWLNSKLFLQVCQQRDNVSCCRPANKQDCLFSR